AASALRRDCLVVAQRPPQPLVAAAGRAARGSGSRRIPEGSCDTTPAETLRRMAGRARRRARCITEWSRNPMSRLTSILVLLSPLAAQSAGPLPEPVQAEHAPRHALRGQGLGAGQVLFDAPGDGSVWAITRTYKAAFDSDGLEFVPFLGSQAPRNFPV